MSNNLQEIKNLQAKIKTVSPKNFALTTLNWFEQHDQNTIKQLCVSCGGKGFYLLIQGVPGGKQTKGILTACDCEDGFIYKKMMSEDNGKT